ncbi:MAG: hypothetical protein ACRDJ4_05300 [Actinomycetota bacterium]
MRNSVNDPLGNYVNVGTRPMLLGRDIDDVVAFFTSLRLVKEPRSELGDGGLLQRPALDEDGLVVRLRAL